MAPSRGARSTNSVFMTSSVTTPAPAFTLWPFDVWTRTTRAGRGEIRRRSSSPLVGSEPKGIAQREPVIAAAKRDHERCRLADDADFAPDPVDAETQGAV